MDAAKRERLEKAGFRVGTVAEFLGLTPEQSELVEIKVALSRAVRKQRSGSSLSQCQLAELIGSSQSRIAKMERGDASVSLDLPIRALIAQGMTRTELAEVIAGEPLAITVEPARSTASTGTARWRRPKSAMPEPVKA